MELKDVNSSSISKLGYDPNTQIMLVVFRTGSTYEFNKVSFDDYQKVFSSPSIGKSFKNIIKYRYLCKKIS